MDNFLNSFNKQDVKSEMGRRSNNDQLERISSSQTYHRGSLINNKLPWYCGNLDPNDTRNRSNDEQLMEYLQQINYSRKSPQIYYPPEKLDTFPKFLTSEVNNEHKLHGLNVSDKKLYSKFGKNEFKNRNAKPPLSRISLNRRRMGNKHSFYFSSPSSAYNLTALFSDSSVPGLREICHSEHYFRKIIWFVAFILLSFLALSDIQRLLSDFYSYPITVDMRLRESRKLPFPAITVCNLNIVRFSALCNSTLNVSMPIELQEKLCGTMLTAMKNTSIEDINDIISDSDTTTPENKDIDQDYADNQDEKQTTKPAATTQVPFKHRRKNNGHKRPNRFKRSSNTQNKPHSSSTNVNLNSNVNKATPSSPDINPELEMFELTERQEKELQENLTTWLAVMANKNKNLTFSLGHQFDDMILRCTIKSSNCTHPNSFVSSFTPTEGNCYTYIAKTNTNPSNQHSKPSTTSVPKRTTTPFPESTSTESSPINPPLQGDMFTTESPPTSSTSNPTLKDRNGNLVNDKNFSHDNEQHNQVETILAGADHGLELVINLETNEYLPGTAQIGALVMLHSPDDFGISASEAILVSPECATYIGLKMMRISRLPAPYPEKCIDVWPKGLQRKSMQNASYSQQACIKICLQKTIQTRCKCQSAFLEQVEFNGTEFRICDTRKKNTRKCVEEVMLRPENKLDDCQCPPRCQVIQYEKTISVARWPTREDRVSFDRGTKDINITNVAKVVVYFQTMTLQEVTQQAAWTTAKLFSSLGGFMGMYVGFSFLSLFEVFEILIRRAWYGLTRRTPSFRGVIQTVLATIRSRNQLRKHNLNHDVEKLSTKK